MPRKRRRKVLTLRGTGIGRPPLYRAGSWCADTEQDRGAPTPSTDREAYERVRLSQRSGADTSAQPCLKGMCGVLCRRYVSHGRQAVMREADDILVPQHRQHRVWTYPYPASTYPLVTLPESLTLTINSFPKFGKPQSPDTSQMNGQV
jgi:hypothetical protein